MRPSPLIAITGLGAISAAGTGVEPLLEALRAGRPPGGEIDRSAGYHRERSAARAATVGALDVREWIPPMVARRMSGPSRYAVAAAQMALRDASIEAGREPNENAGVVVSTAFGPTLHTQRLLDQILLEGPEAASPSLFTECVANAPAAQIAIRAKLRGPNHTISGREAGVLSAVGRAAAEIRSGCADWILAGAVEEIAPLLHSILDRFGSLARARPGLEERARPFDRRRNGFVAAEGSSMLVLERFEHAERRGARPAVAVRAWGSAFDATASRVGWGTGSVVLARSMRHSLERFGLAPEDIDLVVSGASGSVAGDRLEARTLQALWANGPVPPVVAPKGVTGEYGGAFLTAAVLAARGEAFAGDAGFEETDPELDLAPVDGSNIPSAGRVLVTSLASGGGASWLVLERP